MLLVDWRRQREVERCGEVGLECEDRREVGALAAVEEFLRGARWSNQSGSALSSKGSKQRTPTVFHASMFSSSSTSLRSPSSLLPLSSELMSPKLRFVTGTSPPESLSITIGKKLGCARTASKTARKPLEAAEVGRGLVEVEADDAARGCEARRRRMAVAGREMLIKGSVAVEHESQWCSRVISGTEPPHQ